MEKHISIAALKSARGKAPYLRVETKLDSRLNAKLKMKLDSRLDTKLETKLDAKLDSKLETKPDAKHAIRMI